MDHKRGKVFIFSAPSGAGKTTIVRKVLKRFQNFGFSVSATTRKPRPHEIDGDHYHFLTQEDFKQKIEEGAFLEWEEVYEGAFYGTLREEVEGKLAIGKSVIFDVDVQGGLNIKHHYKKEAVAFFIRPPRPEDLKTRLIKRGTETMEEIENRCAKAFNELNYAPLFDFIIINDVLETALEEVYEIVEDHLGIEVRDRESGERS